VIDDSIVVSASAARTEEIGGEVAAAVAPGDVIYLEGDLAAGKTTLVRGLVRELGGDPDEVSSPTFVLVQSYPCSRGPIRELHHVDLYRLEDRLHELRELGLDELLSEREAVVAVEWPKRAIMGWIPIDARVWRIRLTVADDASRRIEIRGPGFPRS
jgi:tRNA threonylcarbamoyl adenosine modification protein YjeE